MAIKYCSFNVRGLINKSKRMQMFNWLKAQPYDFCLLQETHLISNNHKIWEKEWGEKCFFSGTKTNSEGICILLNSNIDVKINNYVDIISDRHNC